MLRKLLLMMAIAVPEMYVRMVCLLILSFVFLLDHWRFEPYDSRDYFILGVLESLNVLCLPIPCLYRLLLELRGESDDAKTSWLEQLLSWPPTDWCTISLIEALNFRFLTLFLWSILRNTVVNAFQEALLA